MANFIQLTRIDDDGSEYKDLINMDQILFARRDGRVTKLFRSPKTWDFKVKESPAMIMMKLTNVQMTEQGED